MKVCMFVLGRCDPDIRVFKEARALTEAGHDVRIVAVMGEGVEPYEGRDGFRILRVTLDPIHRKIMRPASWLARLLGITSQGGRSVSSHFRAREHGTDSSESQQPEPTSSGERVVPLTRRLYGLLSLLVELLPTNYLSYLDYYYRSFRVAREKPADVYHAHDLNALPVAWLSRRFSGGKVVYDSHELWLDRTKLRKRSRFNRFLVQRIESFLIQRTDANIVAGESSAIELSKRYHIVPPTLILNSPSYNPVERSDILRDKIGIPREHSIILYIGRITYYRGLEELVQSLQYLDHSSLVLMGYAPPDYVGGLKRLIRNREMTDKVHFFGPVPPDEVTRYAASADIGVVPIKNAGLSYYYCSPNKVFECIAAGLPVVGSNFPDLKKVIEGHNLGVTCDPEYPRDIANAINYILSDESRYEEMRRNALEAAKIFNWENESKKLLALYEGLSDKAND